MRTPYKMKGMDFGNSPVTKKAGPETNRSVGTDNARQDFEDKEDAIEYAINDNDLKDGEKPSPKQIKKALDYIKAERKAGY